MGSEHTGAIVSLTWKPTNIGPNAWRLYRGPTITDILLRHMPRKKCWRLYHSLMRKTSRGDWRAIGEAVILTLPFELSETEAKTIALNHLTVTQ